MNILFIQTGGTIDKDYPRKTKGYSFEITDAAVSRILKNMNPDFNYEIVSLLKKDSLDMTDDDRKKIFLFCKSSKFDKIIITHGTDTMLLTAKILSKLEDKLIILTGAARPERFSDSDAQFNIGVAIGAANILKHGVYIAMNGRIIEWNRCKRDVESGKFFEK